MNRNSFRTMMLAALALGAIHQNAVAQTLPGLLPPSESDRFAGTAIVRAGGSDDSFLLSHTMKASASSSDSSFSDLADAASSVASKFQLRWRSGHGLFSGDAFARTMSKASVSASARRGVLPRRSYSASIEVLGDVTTVLYSNSSSSGSAVGFTNGERSDRVGSRLIEQPVFAIGLSAVQLSLRASDVEAGFGGSVQASTSSAVAIDANLRSKPGDILVSGEFYGSGYHNHSLTVDDEIELGEAHLDPDIDTTFGTVSVDAPYYCSRAKINLDVLVRERIRIENLSTWSTVGDVDLSDANRGPRYGSLSN